MSMATSIAKPRKVLQDSHEACIREAVFPLRFNPDPLVRMQAARSALSKRFSASAQHITGTDIREFMEREGLWYQKQ